jgi:hypothetical protein
MAGCQFDDIHRARWSGQTYFQTRSEWKAPDDFAFSIFYRPTNGQARKWKASFGGAGSLTVCRLGLRIVFLLDLIFIALLFGLVTYGLTHLEIFSSQGTKWFYLVQIIGVVGAIGTLVALFNALFSWKSKRKRIWGKLGATIMLLACIGVLWFSFCRKSVAFHLDLLTRKDAITKKSIKCATPGGYDWD